MAQYASPIEALRKYESELFVVADCLIGRSVSTHFHSNKTREFAIPDDSPLINVNALVRHQEDWSMETLCIYRSQDETITIERYAESTNRPIAVLSHSELRIYLNASAKEAVPISALSQDEAQQFLTKYGNFFELMKAQDRYEASG